MKIEFIKIKQIEVNKFELTTSIDGLNRTDLITIYNDIPADGLPNMQRLVADNPDFAEIWGSSFEFRQQVSGEIKKLLERSLQNA